MDRRQGIRGKRNDHPLINDLEGKVELTRNDEGIYLKAKKDIKSDENIFIEIKIKDNDGSDYSKVRMNITTFVQPPYSIGRGRVGKECRSRWSPYH